MSFWVALRKELLEQWRTYRLLAVVVVFVVFGMASPLLAKLTPEFFKLLPQGEQIAQLMPPPTIADAIGQYVKNLTQFGVLLALLLAMGAVVQEKEKGTAALMLVKPLARSAFLTAKWVALGLTFLASLLLAGIFGYYYTQLLFEPPDPGGWIALNGLLWLFFLVYLATTLLCSTLGRSQIAAGGMAFGIMILLSVLGALPRVGDYLPGRLLSWGSELAMGKALSGSSGQGWMALTISIGIVVASLLSAWALLQKQEL